jgi:hypothetical protein
MDDRRLGCAEAAFGSDCGCCWGSISVVENDRFRDGDRKELGDSEGRPCVGEG